MKPVGNLVSVLVLSIWITSMKPVGNLVSVLVLPSILTRRCFMMVSTSLLVRAYFRRFLRKRAIGSDSDSLWGPELGLMVNTPPNLSNIQDLGAARRFKCFFGPRGILFMCYFSCRSESSNISL